MADTEKMAVMEMEETLEEMSVEKIKTETAKEDMAVWCIWIL
jgi:hypothetical protein